MAVDFTTVLSKKAEDLKEPVAKPAGTYVCQIMGLPNQKMVKSKQGGDDMPVISYTIKPTFALDDVDRDELKNHPPISDWGNFQRTIDFFLHTEAGQYYHSKFLEDCLDIPPEDKTVGERISETPGRTLNVKFQLKPYTDRSGAPKLGLEIESYSHT